MPLSPLDRDSIKFQLRLCVACRLEKPLSDFYTTKTGCGYMSICKACSYARHKAWCASNREEKNAHQRKYRARHPAPVRAAMVTWLAAHPEYGPARYRKRYSDPDKRVRMLAANRAHQHKKRSNGGRGLTTNELLGLLAQPCRYCGGTSTEIDHVMPVSRGGLHDPSNVVPACRRCNAAKGARTPEEWRSAHAA